MKRKICLGTLYTFPFCLLIGMVFTFGETKMLLGSFLLIYGTIAFIVSFILIATGSLDNERT